MAKRGTRNVASTLGEFIKWIDCPFQNITNQFAEVIKSWISGAAPRETRVTTGTRFRLSSARERLVFMKFHSLGNIEGKMYRMPEGGNFW
jgi:hypothetical protein